MKILFDLECDGLNPTKIWIIVAKDIITGEVAVYSDHDDTALPLDEFKYLFDVADTLIGHNIIGFDLPILERLTGWVPTNQKLVDTLLISQLNDYHRPMTKGSHAMKSWGKVIGDEKHEDPSWLEYSEEMKERCASDVDINVKIYNYLIREIQEIVKKSPDYPTAIKLEHKLAVEVAKQETNGWLFDDAKATGLLLYINNRMGEIEIEIEPKLKPKRSFLDAEPRTAKVLADGRYDRITRNYFGQERPDPSKPIPPTYQRLSVKDTDLGSNLAVIELLLAEGWQPTEYNWKKDGRNWIKKGPKLTDDSFDSITGDLGKMIAEWRILRSRRGFLEGQLKLQRADGKVSCAGFTLGTHTSRMRHRGIVNVPGAGAVLGKEIRACYTSEEGRKVVAADSDGNQLRALCHYINNKDVSTAVAEGSSELGTDIHTRNAKMVGVPRNVVKNLTYALVFGAGDKKLGDTAGMKGQGKALRAKMMEAYDGYTPMLNTIEDQWSGNHFYMDRGFVFGLDGRPVYCEKFRALNNLLQCYEAVTCKAACVKAMEMIREQELDAKLICFYHDEINLDVAEGDAQAAKEILEYCLGDFITEEYNLNIPMSGAGSIGDNWYDVH